MISDRSKSHENEPSGMGMICAAQSCGVVVSCQESSDRVGGFESWLRHVSERGDGFIGHLLNKRCAWRISIKPPIAVVSCTLHLLKGTFRTSHFSLFSLFRAINFPTISLQSLLLVPTAVTMITSCFPSFRFAWVDQVETKRQFPEKAFHAPPTQFRIDMPTVPRHAHTQPGLVIHRRLAVGRCQRFPVRPSV
jgi:hypothetical protein